MPSRLHRARLLYSAFTHLRSGHELPQACPLRDEHDQDCRRKLITVFTRLEAKLSLKVVEKARWILKVFLSEKQRHRVLAMLLKHLKPLGPDGAINNAVVATQGDAEFGRGTEACRYRRCHTDT